MTPVTDLTNDTEPRPCKFRTRLADLFFHIGRRLIECSDSKLLNERRTRERSPKSTTPGARDLMRAEILCIASFSCEINQRGRRARRAVRAPSRLRAGVRDPTCFVRAYLCGTLNGFDEMLISLLLQ